MRCSVAQVCGPAPSKVCSCGTGDELTTATDKFVYSIESSPGDYALARFFRTLSTAALHLAQDLEAGTLGQGRLPLEGANLGSLQRLIVDMPGMDSAAGVSPREITQQLDRGDEPNIRTALAAMAKRGVTELVSGASPSVGAWPPCTPIGPT